MYLIHALNGWVDGKFTPVEDGQQDARVETLQLLLEQQSLDPNTGPKSETAWALCLDWLAHYHSMVPASVRECMCNAMKLFLSNGADPKAYCRDPDSDSVIGRALPILQRLYPTEATVFEQLANTNRGRLLAMPASERQQSRGKSPIRRLMDRFRSQE
jgi:hypothetical protein